MQTAMQLSSTQQQQQQYRSGATAGSPGSSGNAYRALSLPALPAAVGGSSNASASTGLPSGSSLLGALTGPLSMPQTGAVRHGTQAFSSAAGGSSSFWTSAEHTGPAAAVEAAAVAAGSVGSSRLSRLSRPRCPGMGPVGTAVAAEAVQLSGGTAVHQKAMASLHSQALAAHSAVDAFQQQDQGFGPQGSGTAGFRSSSEPQSPSAGGTSGDYIDSSVEGQPGSSISPMSDPAGSISGQQQQQQQQGLGQGHAVTARRSPAAATAGSPSAGLATLMQALDTTGTGTAVAGQGGSGHVAGSCGQQQAAILMDM
jgi:hypothetical protein